MTLIKILKIEVSVDTEKTKNNRVALGINVTMNGAFVKAVHELLEFEEELTEGVGAIVDKALTKATERIHKEDGD